jgi:hypothetical protein
VLPDDDKRYAIETCRSGESVLKWFKVNNVRLIHNTQLVRLLVMWYLVDSMLECRVIAGWVDTGVLLKSWAGWVWKCLVNDSLKNRTFLRKCTSGHNNSFRLLRVGVKRGLLFWGNNVIISVWEQSMSSRAKYLRIFAKTALISFATSVCPSVCSNKWITFGTSFRYVLL